MKIHFLFWLLFVFLLKTNAFAQDVEELRLFSEANKTRFISPEKSFKLYDYLLKNSESKLFSIEVEIKELEVNRFLGEYRNAIQNSKNIENQLKTSSSKKLKFLYYIEMSKLYQDLGLLEKAFLALKKSENIYNDFPTEISDSDKIELNLAQNYILSDSNLQQKIDGLQSILTNIQLKDERLPWLQYRLYKLYFALDIDSDKNYAKSISTESDFEFLSCIFYDKPCNASVFQDDFKGLQLHPDLKIAVLKHNLQFWETTNQKDSIVEIRAQLQDIENVFEIEKKQAKVDLLQYIYEVKKQRVYEKQESNKKRWFFGILFLCAVLLAYFGISFYRNSLKNKSSEEVEEETISKTIVISDKTEGEILEKLDQFESSKLFLDQQMRIATLAKHLDTNTRYLSTIINSTKDKSFNNYINSLRINYILEKLVSDPKYLTYKISYLADVSGFASQSSFTTAFKEVTGKTPSVYIRDLETSE